MKQIWKHLLLLAFVLAACQRTDTGEVLRLATTTSTYDSGLLGAILPEFEATYGVEVEVIAVGSGQAIALGERGDVDAVLVHAPSLEISFVENGFGLERVRVMYNDFVFVGPIDDPIGIGAAHTAAEALTWIAEGGAQFASRGDQSGTHVKEMLLWELAGIEPTSDQPWYLSLGQGMGDTLNFANEVRAYVLSDRGTFLAQQNNLPNLKILFFGETAKENIDPELINVYSVIAVNPALHENVNAAGAQLFIEWLISVETQEMIGVFGLDRFAVPLFVPDSLAFSESRS